jgi:hypothetical protein
LGVRQVGGVAEELLHPLEITGDLVSDRPVQAQAGERLHHRLDPIL